MSKFHCNSCGNEFSCQESPRFCPVCGGSNFRPVAGKARMTALRLAADAACMVPELDNRWEEYVSMLADYELKMVTLRQYKHRGIIKENEMPSREKETLAHALKRIREERNAAK